MFRDAPLASYLMGRVTVAGRAIHRLDQFWVTGNFAFHSPKVTEATEARCDDMRCYRPPWEIPLSTRGHFSENARQQ
jgi:hypothetical protein